MYKSTQCNARLEDPSPLEADCPPKVETRCAFLKKYRFFSHLSECHVLLLSQQWLKKYNAVQIILRPPIQYIHI